MAAFTIQDLRLLICEDEYLLAIDMAQQFSSLGATVVGTAGSLADIRRFTSQSPFEANAAVVDVRLSDGESFEGIRLLREAGAAVVVCSGYTDHERPPELADVPWLGKPARAEDIATALRAVLDSQSGTRIDD